MIAPLVGGCQCGAVRYRIDPPAPVAYACHCRECQKQSASAFALSLSVAREQLSVAGGGAVASWERPTDLGSWTQCFFCPTCGSRVYHVSSLSPDRMTIKGGSLDDTSELRPAAHIWVSRKQPWVVLDPEVPAHETQPADLAAWRNGLEPSR